MPLAEIRKIAVEQAYNNAMPLHLSMDFQKLLTGFHHVLSSLAQHWPKFNILTPYLEKFSRIFLYCNVVQLLEQPEHISV